MDSKTKVRHERWCAAEYGPGACQCLAGPLLQRIEELEAGIQDIIDRHERPSSMIVSTDFNGNPWPVLVPVAELRSLLDAR